MQNDNNINNNSLNQNNFNMQGNVLYNQQPQNNQTNQINTLNTTFNQPQAGNIIYPNSYQQPNGNQSIKAPKKINSGLIIGIISSVVVCIAIVIGVLLLTNNKMEQNSENKDQSSDNVVVKDYTSVGILKDNLNLDYTEEGTFMMVVSDRYTWAGAGTMVIGEIIRGTIRKGDQIQILGFSNQIKETTVKRVEIDRKEIEYGKIGDTVTILLSDYERSEIFQGQVVVEPNSMIASTKFEAEINIVSDLDITGDYYFEFINGSKKVTMKFGNDIQKLSSDEKVISTVYVEDIQPMEVGHEVQIKQNDVAVGTAKIIKIFN